MKKRAGGKDEPGTRRRRDASVEARLEAVRAARASADTAEGRAVISRALADSSHLVVATAADIVGNAELAELAGEVGAAFDRFMVNPVQTDKTCLAKTAIARALLRLGADDRRVYLAGMRHIQLEAAWGKPEETAGELRGLCVLGLVRARHPDAALFVAERLADDAHTTREAAARAAAELDPTAALPLLRYKVAVGDARPEVIAACFVSLLELAPGTALALAAAYLKEHPGALAEAVAVALGESRHRDAFDVLKEWSATQVGAGSSRRVALVALALLRDDRAFDHLIDLVRQGSAGTAEDALRALGHFKHDPRLTTRTLEAVRARPEPKLLDLARSLFDGGA